MSTPVLAQVLTQVSGDFCVNVGTQTLHAQADASGTLTDGRAAVVVAVLEREHFVHRYAGGKDKVDEIFHGRCLLTREAKPKASESCD